MVPDEEAFKWAMSGCAKVPLSRQSIESISGVSRQDRAWKFSVDVLREMLGRVLCESRIGWDTVLHYVDCLGTCMYLC
jgi:hypothetical protein